MLDPTRSLPAAPSPAPAPPPSGEAGAFSPPAGDGEAVGPPPASAFFLRWAPVLLLLFAGAAAALAPLYDIDLPQHLAVGEWIFRHHAVPFSEPFAWTRQGQPYFAYSWLPELLYYALLRAFGPVALHLLQGAITAASVAAALWAGRQLRLRDSAALALAALQLMLLWGVAPVLRPQQLVLVAVPLAWGAAARIRERRGGAGNLLALFTVGALAANTHIFFPFTAIPIAFYVLAEARRGELRRWLPAGAALFAGWLATPYAPVWPRVLALNFGHNVLLGRPPSIAEFLPGFEYWGGQAGVIAAVLALLAAPWIVAADKRRPTRWRVTSALAWTAGLLMFAYAGRLVFGWWALAFPLVGEAADRALAAGRAALSRPFGRLLVGGVGAIALVGSAPAPRPRAWAFEGDAVHRMLPRAADYPALWIPSWLLCHTRSGAGGRIFTEFNYGSELNWRLPGYSPSIDGRTIFPDSDAADFSFSLYGARRRHASTWTHADLALVDRTFWLAPVLDHDSSWVFLAQSGHDWRGAGLWARRAWWKRWGLPATTLPALRLLPGDPRGLCAGSGRRVVHRPEARALRRSPPLAAPASPY